MRKRLPELLCFAGLIVAFAGLVAYFMLGGQIWFKSRETFKHQGFIFTADPPGQIYEGTDGIVYQEPPEKPCIGLNSNISPDVNVIVLGDFMLVRGTFYKSWPGRDIYPAFTREELLDKLLEEGRSAPNMPENVELDFHPRFVAFLYLYDMAARNDNSLNEIPRRHLRRASQMLGSVD